MGVQLPAVCDRESLIVKLDLDKYEEMPEFIVNGGLTRGISDWEDEFY